MTADVSIEPEEAQAIAEAFHGERRSTTVATRNFAEPRRLSGAGLARLGRSVGAALTAVAESLEVPLRRNHKLALAALREVNAASSLEGLEEPFAVLGFAVGGRRGWLVWDSAAAVALVETILAGTPGEGAAARALSPAERRLLETTLAQIVQPVVAALGGVAEGARFVQLREEVASLEATLDADPQRVCVQLAFDGPGGPSELRLYVPGVRVSVATDERTPATPPAHLDEVGLELRAFLGSADVPLSDLLALEIGDVIPLGVRRGEPVQVCVEDRACATARLGRTGSRLAVRIETLDVHEGEFEPTSD